MLQCGSICDVCVALQDLKNRRNPRLVPYSLLDERTKKSNRDSLREAVRTLVGYGYNIDPPDQECEESPERVVLLASDPLHFFIYVFIYLSII